MSWHSLCDSSLEDVLSPELDVPNTVRRAGNTDSPQHDRLRHWKYISIHHVCIDLHCFSYKIHFNWYYFTEMTYISSTVQRHILSLLDNVVLIKLIIVYNYMIYLFVFPAYLLFKMWIYI